MSSSGIIESSPDNSICRCITDVPDTLLGNVASYLVKPSWAMFAVALTAPTSNWVEPNSSSRSVINHGPSKGTQWEELDFEEIDQDFASKLNDDDLAAILLCIDSRSKLKKLKLAGCINITGRGLGTLQGSTVVEQIDMSMVALNSSPSITPVQLAISEDDMIPILKSIVQIDGSTLRQLHLPLKWCGYRNRSRQMEECLQLYNSLLGRRDFDCFGGVHEAGECFGTDGGGWLDSYARQKFTCYLCLQNACDDPAVEVAVKNCMRCEKMYCDMCNPIVGSVCKMCTDKRQFAGTCSLAVTTASYTNFP